MLGHHSEVAEWLFCVDPLREVKAVLRSRDKLVVQIESSRTARYYLVWLHFALVTVKKSLEFCSPRKSQKVNWQSASWRCSWVACVLAIRLFEKQVHSRRFQRYS